MNTASSLMDRRVKERLIGATILVTLIVLIVPELLSGPKPAPVPPLAAGLPGSTRNVSVNLATSKATPEPQLPDASAASVAGAPATGSSNAAAASASTEQEGVAAASAISRSAPASSSGGAQGASTPGGPPTVTTLRAQEPAGPLESADSPPRSANVSARAARSSAEPVSSGAEAAPNHRGWAVQLGVFASKSNAEKLLHQLPGNGFYVMSSGSGTSLRYRVRLGPLADRDAAERAVTKLKAMGHQATVVAPAS